MPYAKITLTIPESLWISEISTSHPETEFRVLAATANAATGVARIELRGPDTKAITRKMEEYDSVTDLTVFEADSDRVRLQVETTVPLLLTSLQNAGVPIETPFEVHDGTVMIETTISQRKLSSLAETLDTVGLSYSVDRIQQDTQSENLLTPRQQWLLDKAIDRGYYDSPRRTTLVELAAELDMAKSTCSEILHRAEEGVVKEYRENAHGSGSEVAVSSD